MPFSLEKYGDLFTKFYSSSGLVTGLFDGTGNGFTFNNGILLYGRVSEILYNIPESMRSAIDTNTTTFVAFDMFAYQEGPSKPLLYTAGRVALLFPYKFTDVNFKPIITAVLCNLYGIQQEFSSYSNVTNLVTACLFQHTNSGIKVQPATFAPASYMLMSAEDEQLFQDNFINCSKMITIYDVLADNMPQKPSRLGVDCALLMSSNANQFAFYRKDRYNTFEVSANFASRSEYEIKYPSGPAEDRKHWVLTAELVVRFVAPRLLNFDSASEKMKQIADESANLSRLVFRDAKALPEIYDVVIYNLNDAHSRMKDKLDSIESETEQTDLPSLIDILCLNIFDYLKSTYRSKDATGKTGATRIKQILKGFSKVAEDLGLFAIDDICELAKDKSLEAILTSLLPDITATHPGYLDDPIASIRDWLSFSALSANKVKLCFILGFVWSVLGLRCSFSALLNFDSLVVAYYLVNNPYILAIVCPDLSLATLDKLAAFTGVIGNANVLEDRLVACMHSTVMNKSEETGSIIFKYESLRGGLITSFATADRDARPGYMLSDAVVDIANKLLQNITQPHFELPDAVHYPFNDALLRYVESGFGLYFNYKGAYYIMDISHAIMFASVCNYFAGDCNPSIACTAITDVDSIANDIALFEAEKAHTLGISEFKLEPEQKEVYKLAAFPFACLIGPAGSGKTTSLELLIRLLRKQKPDIKIQLAAPTGMAARRMTECTRGCGCDNAKTLHSLLRIGSTSFSFGRTPDAIEDIDKTINAQSAPDVVILDECSMLSLNLLYFVVCRYKNIRPRFILVGDIKQLPPIEVGKPFVDLLSFLPIVYLHVSKRAALGSDITRVANSLNNRNLGDIMVGEHSDVSLLDIPETRFVDTCKELLSYYIKNTPTTLPLVNDGQKYNARDIQIVTPVSTEKYTWGTSALNEAVRDLFNPATYSNGTDKECVSYTLGSASVTLRVGDRVINTQNDYNRNHYLPFNVGEDPVAFDKGIVNGDIGYIKRICWASDIDTWYTQISREEGELISLDEPVEDRVAKGYWKPTKNRRTGNLDSIQPLCVFVEFYDSSNMPYWVAFRVTADTDLYTCNDAVLRDSEDIRCLSLAYAITVHKMQGSQAKLILAPLYKCGRGSFLSRNLIYTAWTRAESGLYVIGDIAPTYTSALGRAIDIDAVAPRKSPLDIID